MLKLKKIITKYKSLYLYSVIIIWFFSLLITWNLIIKGHNLYFIVAKVILPICGAISLLLSFITKEMAFIVLAITCLFAHWIHLMFILGLLPIFGN
ncbi:hypothetical protein [Streptococcus uberis]|uniref:hypothetical protein n=1 Tax=Streptococcus uberis TaxID=1349 RepID=UPI003D6B3E67